MADSCYSCVAGLAALLAPPPNTLNSPVCWLR
jgi:hypothetical protein